MLISYYLDVDPEDLDNAKEARKEAKGAQGLNKTCRDIVSRLPRPITGFWNALHWSPLWRTNASGT